MVRRKNVRVSWKGSGVGVGVGTDEVGVGVGIVIGTCGNEDGDGWMTGGGMCGLVPDI